MAGSCVALALAPLLLSSASGSDDPGLPANPMTISVAPDGAYTLEWHGRPALASAPVGLQTNSGWCDTASHCLRPAGAVQRNVGQDSLGKYTRSALSYTRVGRPLFETAFRVYADSPVVVFEARFVTGVANASIPVELEAAGEEQGEFAARISPQTAFPAWRADAGPRGLLLGGDAMASLSWDDIGTGQAAPWRLGDGPLRPGPKPATSAAPLFMNQTAYEGGWRCTGVTAELKYGRGCQHPGSNLALFNANQSIVMLHSPLGPMDSVMTRRVRPFQAGARLGAAFQQLRTGVAGTMASIPPGHRYESVIWGGQHGLNHAYEGWGTALLRYYGKKQRTSYSASLATSHLGYSTCGYYFYATEGATKRTNGSLKVGEDYADTLAHVAEEARARRLPYRYALLDSWWYGEYGHSGSGMFSWDESSARASDALDPVRASAKFRLLKVVSTRPKRGLACWCCVVHSTGDSRTVSRR